jgi:large subunit ribosomal protein L31
MKAGIHPVYELRTFHCYGCGTEWQTRTTIEPHSSDGKIHLDICSNCHPFFTGKQKLIDKAGRVERFRKRYSKKEDAAKPPPSPQRPPSASDASTASVRSWFPGRKPCRFSGAVAPAPHRRAPCHFYLSAGRP